MSNTKNNKNNTIMENTKNNKNNTIKIVNEEAVEMTVPELYTYLTGKEVKKPKRQINNPFKVKEPKVSKAQLVERLINKMSTQQNYDVNKYSKLTDEEFFAPTKKVNKSECLPIPGTKKQKGQINNPFKEGDRVKFIYRKQEHKGTVLGVAKWNTKLTRIKPDDKSVSEYSEVHINFKKVTYMV